MISWLKNGEEITIHVDNVKFKKDNGSLYVTNVRICWINANANLNPTIQYEYHKIKAQRISPDAAEKVRLQLVLYDDSAITFHFNNPKKELQKPERERVKEILVELIQRSKQKAASNQSNGNTDKQLNQMNKVLEMKQRILQSSEEMLIMYKTLVSQEIINAEDFWNIPLAQELLESERTKEQSQGVTSAFLSEAKPEVDGCNSIQYNLTTEIIQSIFHTYPMIKRKHQELVPSKITEKEFWTKFFQSQYFHQNRSSKSLGDGKGEDIFSNLAVEDEQTSLQKFLLSERNPVLDVSEDGAGSSDDFGTMKFKNEKPGVKPLIRKYNHHSFMICRTLNKDHINPDSSFKHQIQNLTLQEDLLPKEKESVNVLKMTKNQTEIQKLLCSPEEASVYLNFTKQDIINCSLDGMRECIDSNEVYRAITSISKKPDKAIPKVSTRQMEDIRLCYLNASQILRHFWMCFPITDTSTEEKISRMVDSLNKFRVTVLRDMNMKLSIPEQVLIKSINEQIDLAIDAHKQWLTKKTRR